MCFSQTDTGEWYCIQTILFRSNNRPFRKINLPNKIILFIYLFYFFFFKVSKLLIRHFTVLKWCCHSFHLFHCWKFNFPLLEVNFLCSHDLRSETLLYERSPLQPLTSIFNNAAHVRGFPLTSFCDWFKYDRNGNFIQKASVAFVLYIV